LRPGFVHSVELTVYSLLSKALEVASGLPAGPAGILLDL
jgi:hypothetical protein